MQSPEDGAEGYIYTHAGIQARGDLDPAIHDWNNPVAKIDDQASPPPLEIGPSQQSSEQARRDLPQSRQPGRACSPFPLYLATRRPAQRPSARGRRGQPATTM